MYENTLTTTCSVHGECPDGICYECAEEEESNRIYPEPGEDPRMYDDVAPPEIDDTPGVYPEAVGG